MLESDFSQIRDHILRLNFLVFIYGTYNHIFPCMLQLSNITMGRNNFWWSILPFENYQIGLNNLPKLINSQVQKVKIEGLEQTF